MKMNRLEKSWVAIAVVLRMTFTAQAEFMINPTENVPIIRLIANVQKQVVRNPKDPQWHYTLGRLHSMLAVGITNGVTPKPAEGNINNAECLPLLETFGGDFTWRPRVDPPPLKPDQIAEHFDNAIAEYKQTIQLQTNHVYAWMGLAWCSQQNGNKDTAISAYRKAHELAWAAEKDSGGLYHGSSMTVESGNALLKLLPKVGGEREKAEIARRMAKINAKPMMITPIILPVGEETTLAALTGTDRATRPTAVFDFAGNDTPLRWEWITHKAAFLVSDPNYTGRVTSGRQLFGSSSWWIMWPDGYAALSALDDNLDGLLTGAELDGISLWHDKNENAIADPGEVTPVRSGKIQAIACRPRGIATEGVLTDQAGIIMLDGTTRPTYDWLPRRLP